MRDRRRHRSPGVVGHEVVERQPAERALVDEAQLAPAVGEREAGAEVGLVRRVAGLDQQLAAHPEVGDQGGVAAVETEPEVLPAPRGRRHGAAAQPGLEIGATTLVAADGARVQHLRLGDRATRDPPLEAPTDDLDLGQLGH